MDNNLLKQLIAQHRRVVVPDFGAFLKKETPEGDRLVFSPFLRKDDGIVTEAIIGEYGVESEDARAMVAEFVAHLRQSLTSSGRYYIEGVGMLTADANATITLKEGETPAVPEAVETIEPETVPMPAAVQTQLPKPGVTRPQSIQVQGQPQPHTAAPSPAPSQQPARHPFGGGYPAMGQQPGSPVPPGSPAQQGQPTRPPMPQQPGYPPRPPMPQQPMTPPVPPGSAMQQGQPPRSPMQQGQPVQQPMRPPIPPSQRQPPMSGGGMPPRGPQDPQHQQHQQHPQRTGMPNSSAAAGRGPGGPRGPQQPHGGRRPAPHRNRPQKTKADMWLIVAIIAALVVIAIMIYSFIISGGNGEIDMEMINAAMTPLQDTTATANP